MFTQDRKRYLFSETNHLSMLRLPREIETASVKSTAGTSRELAKMRSDDETDAV